MLFRSKESVHLSDWPKANPDKIDSHTEQRMDLVRTLVGLGRGAREKARIKVRQPLAKVLLDEKYRPLMEDLTPLVQEELNIKKVVFVGDLSQYMEYSLKPNFKVAGPVLGQKIKAFGRALTQADPAGFLEQLHRNGSVRLELDGTPVDVTGEMVEVRIEAKEGFAVAMENNVFVILDTELDQDLVEEGLVREVISKVQQLRKQNDFDMMDRIDILLQADDEVHRAVTKHQEYIMKETLADTIRTEDGGLKEYSVNGHKTGIGVKRK